jgi:hypothetical protein
MSRIVFASRRPGVMDRVGLLLLLSLAAGCGPGRSAVSGRVLLDGQPLPGGRVTFRPADSRENAVSAELDEQGNYQAVLPAGDVLVSVDNRELDDSTGRTGGLPPDLPLSPEARQQLGGGGLSTTKDPDKRADLYRPIPGRYYQAETAELGFAVKGGDMKHDIELSSKEKANGRLTPAVRLGALSPPRPPAPSAASRRPPTPSRTACCSAPGPAGTPRAAASACPP